MAMNTHAHWQQVYESMSPHEVSWYQASPTLSLDLIQATGLDKQASIIDVGGGASCLVDELLNLGYEQIAVADVSDAAIHAVKGRLGGQAQEVEWYVADMTQWDPPHQWDLWHDRAVFHFQVEEAARDGYLAALRKGVRPGGWAMIATFALDGPTRCSGLPVQRYGPEELASVLGDQWSLVETRKELHDTPSGSTQSFGYCLFQRTQAS
jgi:2-polyprenyl-3-methyl-5-hydroxy-6-metoxy-1,4-benzoquinol methylase